MKSITLYHGTDARIIEMSGDERKQYLADCNLVIDALFPYFKPLFQQEKVEKIINNEKCYVYEYGLKKYEKALNDKNGPYGYYNLLEKIMMLDARKNGSGLYQYNDLYLCSSKDTAIRYARRSFAGGEIGLNAIRLIEGVDVITFNDLDLDDNQNRAINRVRDFAEVGNERPAVVTIENIDINYLTFEDGKELYQDDIEDLTSGEDYNCKFRYTKLIELKNCKVELLAI